VVLTCAIKPRVFLPSTGRHLCKYEHTVSNEGHLQSNKLHFDLKNIFPCIMSTQMFPHAHFPLQLDMCAAHKCKQAPKTGGALDFFLKLYKFPPALPVVSCSAYFFDPGDGGDMFLRNVGWRSTDYTKTPALTPVSCSAYFFDGDMFLRNVGWLSTDYTALYPRRRYSS
jgi:hypothetical protein